MAISIVRRLRGRTMRSAHLVRILVGCGLCLALACGVAALFTEAQAGPACRCPLVYSPVKCSNGKTYSNLCVANCNHATGCVPIPLVPPPV